jgi:hypothetical protein
MELLGEDSNVGFSMLVNGTNSALGTRGCKFKLAPQ